MKTLMLILLLVVTTSSWGQALRELAFESKYPPFKEVYTVLRDDKKIKHGEYRKLFGYFILKGRYENNQRVGVWECYGREGKLEQRIDFANDSIFDLNAAVPFDKYFVKVDEEYKEIKPEVGPIFIGGKKGFLYYFKQLKYSTEAKRNQIQGTVRVSAIITKEGKMIDEKIEEGVDYRIDGEALKVMKIFPDEWIPGKVNGEKTEMKVLFSFMFKLGNKK